MITAEDQVRHDPRYIEYLCDMWEADKEQLQNPVPVQEDAWNNIDWINLRKGDMARLSDFTGGQYLKASDFDGNGECLKIEDARVEVIQGDGNRTEEKIVVHFEGKSKGLVLNSTNTNNLIEITGAKEEKELIGWYCVVFQTTTDFSGRTVNCLRVRAPAAGSSYWNKNKERRADLDGIDMRGQEPDEEPIF